MNVAGPSRADPSRDGGPPAVGAACPCREFTTAFGLAAGRVVPADAAPSLDGAVGNWAGELLEIEAGKSSPNRRRCSRASSVPDVVSGCPPPAAGPCPACETTVVGPKSISAFPRAAVTAPAAANDEASVNAALELAFKSDGCCLPCRVLTANGVACRVALGSARPARLFRTMAGELGDMAGPNGIVCVARRREAEPDTTAAGLDAAGSARPRFGRWPTPAAPPDPLLTANCAGLGSAAALTDGDVASTGFSAAVDDATSASGEARRGTPARSLDGVMEGWPSSIDAFDLLAN